MAFNIRTSKQITPDLEVLVNAVNVDVAASIIVDASTVAPDGNGDRKLRSGSARFRFATGFRRSSGDPGA